MSHDVACLLVQAGSHPCAIPLAAAVETMRPLPADRLPGMPAALLGLAVIRGMTVPVVDLAALFGERAGAPERYVLARAGGRFVALAVTAVDGVAAIDGAEVETGGAIAAGVAAPCVDAVVTRGGRALAVLDVARILPEVIAGAIDRAGASAHE
ncbi:MAG: chemotaxis protein CheW [Minicystis sp.]